MVTLPQLIALAFPQAVFSPEGNVAVTDDGKGLRITKWDVATLGPVPAFDDQSKAYPDLQARQADVEKAQSDKQQAAVAAELEREQIASTVIDPKATLDDRVAFLEKAVSRIIKDSL